MAGLELDGPSEELTPQELNAKFRKFLDSLPDPLPTPGLLDIEEEDLTPEERVKYENTSYSVPEEALEWMRKFNRGIQREHTLRRERENSPELAHLSDELLSLLSHAPITPIFQQVLDRTFRSAYVNGKPTENEAGLSTRLAVYQGLHEYMVMDDPESAGVFDPKNAEEMERKAYQSQAFMLAFVVGAVDKTYGSGTFGEIMSDPGRQNPMFRHRLVPARDMARRWRQEFISRYGKQP